MQPKPSAPSALPSHTSAKHPCPSFFSRNKEWRATSQASLANPEVCGAQLDEITVKLKHKPSAFSTGKGINKENTVLIIHNHACTRKDGRWLALQGNIQPIFAAGNRGKTYYIGCNAPSTMYWLTNQGSCNGTPTWGFCRSCQLIFFFLEIVQFWNRSHYCPFRVIQTLSQHMKSLFSPSIFGVWDFQTRKLIVRVIEFQHTHPYFPKLPISQSLDQLQGFSKDFPDIFSCDRQILKLWHSFVTGDYEWKQKHITLFLSSAVQAAAKVFQAGLRWWCSSHYGQVCKFDSVRHDLLSDHHNHG